MDIRVRKETQATEGRQVLREKRAHRVRKETQAPAVCKASKGCKG